MKLTTNKMAHSAVATMRVAGVAGITAGEAHAASAAHMYRVIIAGGKNKPSASSVAALAAADPSAADLRAGGYYYTSAASVIWHARAGWIGSLPDAGAGFGVLSAGASVPKRGGGSEDVTEDVTITSPMVQSWVTGIPADAFNRVIGLATGREGDVKAYVTSALFDAYCDVAAGRASAKRRADKAAADAAAAAALAAAGGASEDGPDDADTDGPDDVDGPDADDVDGPDTDDAAERAAILAAERAADDAARSLEDRTRDFMSGLNLRDVALIGQHVHDVIAHAVNLREDVAPDVARTVAALAAGFAAIAASDVVTLAARAA